MENEEVKFETSQISRNGMTITVGAVPVAVPSAADDWEGVPERYPVGTRLHGKVVNFKPYGFFVETTEGFFGLVHGSQIDGWDFRNRYDSVFSLGQEVDVTVTKVDPEKHRMAFSYVMTEADKRPPEASPKPEEPAAPAAVPTYAETAVRWTEAHSEDSARARAWLAEELKKGPIYGPLASVLNDRFGVPLPVSFWARQFDEFICYGGKGDNPSDLPAVALRVFAGDDGYWKKFRTKSSELVGLRTPDDEAAKTYGPIAAKLNALTNFPGTVWIRAYGERAVALGDAVGGYGAPDAMERLVVPMLAQLGWDDAALSGGASRIVRGEPGGFDLKVFDGEGRPRVALVCAAVGMSFRDQRDRGGAAAVTLSSRNAVERTLGLANQLKGFDEHETKVVWTDGVEWIVFTEAALQRRIGILSDRSGGQILDETAGVDDNPVFRRLVFPSGGAALDWLGVYAELSARIGR